MTNDTTRTPSPHSARSGQGDRALDLTIDIDATLEEVWQALTTGEGIARWFAPYAAVTPGEEDPARFTAVERMTRHGGNVENLKEGTVDLIRFHVSPDAPGACGLFLELD